MREALAGANLVRVSGRVTQVVGLTVEVVGLNCQIGEICEIQTNTRQALRAESSHGLFNQLPFGDHRGA